MDYMELEKDKNQKNEGGALNRWFTAIPLLISGSFITLLLGVTVWLVLDDVQSKELKKLLTQDVDKTLENELSDARIRLTNYLDDYMNFSFVLSKQVEGHFLQHVQRLEVRQITHNHVVNFEPNWDIYEEYWSYHVDVDSALIFDDQFHLLDVLSLNNEKPRKSIIDIDPYLIQLSENESYLTTIDGKAVLLSSRQFKVNSKFYYLVIVKEINDQFLISSQKNALSKGKVIAIFDNVTHSLIASTSAYDKSKQLYLNDFGDEFLLAGKQFLDLGSSELEVQFTLMIPLSQHEKLNAELLILDRRNRLFAIIIMSSILFIAFIYFSRSIIKLANKVSRHSSKTFLSEKNHQVEGNEFHYLNDVFDRFALRALSDKQLEEQRFINNSRLLQISVLSGITGELNVGVLINEGGEFISSNNVMDGYIQQCGSIELFTKEIQSHREINLIDINLKHRVFKCSLIQLDDGSEVAIVQDITEIKLHSEALEEMALHDALTKLPNRTLLNDRIDLGFKLSKRERRPCLLFMMDLNNFKNINDTLGHSAGDDLLKQVAQRMSQQIRESDTLARIGGDEFAILLFNSDVQQAISIAKKIKKSISSTFYILDNAVEIGVSIGISSVTHSKNNTELLSQADIAMYHAKREKLEYCFYSLDIDPIHSDRALIIESIKPGIQKKEFKLFYQPQITSTDDTHLAFEALVRWYHPLMGFLAPNMFIALAEESGLINELTQYIFTQAVEQCELWRDQGYYVHVSVNLSAANLLDTGLIPYMGKILEESKLDSKQITLEITESMLMQDQNDVDEKLHQIKQLGMGLSIDDFGTGYSSLAYLRHMPVDELKIDQSFVADIKSEQSDLTLIRSIIDLAHNLDLEVVAEGVETQQQIDVLEKLHCERLQGYFFSKPMAVEQVDEWLEKNHHPQSLKTLPPNINIDTLAQ